MSYRGPAVAISSMAQQAVPSGIGQRELRRAQLTMSSSRVTKSPSSDALSASWIFLSDSWLSGGAITPGTGALTCGPTS